MGKRKHHKSEEKIRRKIRRLERRLEKRVESELSEEDSECEYLISSDRSVKSVVRVPYETDTPANDLSDIEIPPELPNNSSATQGDKDTSIMVNSMPPIPNDILEALGTSKTKTELFAPKIRDEISERWGQIIVDGLNKECMQKLLENIHIPENLTLLKAPLLNPELASVLTDIVKNRDKRLEKAQNHLGQCIAAIANLTSSLIDNDLEKSDVIKKVSEVGQLLLDLHCQNTYARRKLVSYSLDKKFVPIIQGSKRDSFLFGENLGEKIKANKMAERSGLQIKFKRTYDPQPSTSSHQPNQPPPRQVNSRGPPRPQRGRKGGPRNFEPAQSHKRPRTTTSHNDRNKPFKQNYRN